jgi:aryl-alcohol dehydrogenase-like predicted oxidoreductase
MTLRKLGQSEIEISPIGLGCWQFSKNEGMAGSYWPSLDDDTTRDIVAASIKGGINWFDTAEVYGWGKSEQGLAHALKTLGVKETLIATKWWPLLRFAGSIGETFPEREKCLAPYRVDLYQVHQPFGLSSVKDEMREMARLFKAGKIRAVGVSNYSAKQMRQAHKALAAEGIPLASNQVKYHMLDRAIEKNGTLATAVELGITIIAYSPLAQGVLSGKFHAQPDLLNKAGMRRLRAEFLPWNMKKAEPVIHRLKELAEKYKSSSAQIALNWLIHFSGETVVAIPGATKLAHVEDNVGAMKFALTPSELNELAQLSQGFQ